MTKTLTTDEKIAELQARFGRKELTAGCELFSKKYFKEQTNGFLVVNSKPWSREGKKYLECTERGTRQDGWQAQLRLHSEKIDILGHPLTLSDVLGAMGKKGLEININSKGKFFYHADLGFNDVNFFWNLSHNLLRDQSEETIGEIYELLK